MTAHTGQKMLVAMRADLTLPRIPVYEPVRVHPDVDRLWGITLLRGRSRLVAPVSAVLREDTGRCYVDAARNCASESLCRYLLVRQIGGFDRREGLLPGGDPMAIYGVTSWERCDVLMEPGPYYVVGQMDRERTDYLLGPFDRHVAALAHLDEARVLSERQSVITEHVGYAVVKYEGEPGQLPQGRLEASEVPSEVILAPWPHPPRAAVEERLAMHA